LAGQLPLDSAVWSPLGSLQTLNLANNQLGGFVPPQLANLTALEDLQLEGNELVGNLPRSLPGSTLRSLNLADNQITGAVSWSWGLGGGVLEVGFWKWCPGAGVLEAVSWRPRPRTWLIPRGVLPRREGAWTLRRNHTFGTRWTQTVDKGSLVRDLACGQKEVTLPIHTQEQALESDTPVGA
jgi:hypothetical protein